MDRRFASLLLAFCAVLLLLPSRGAAALQQYLKVGVNIHLPPYQFLNESGNCAGMHVDMLDRIAADKEFVLDYLPYETSRECLAALESGEVDVILGVVNDFTDGKSFANTYSISTSQLCMIVRNEDLDQNTAPLFNTAVYASDTVLHSSLLANLGVSQFISVGNQQAVYETQLEHSRTAMVGIKNSLIYQLTEHGVSDDYTVLRNYLDTISYTLAVRRDDVELLRHLNDGITRFKASRQYEELYNQWSPLESQEARSLLVIRRISIGATALLVILLVYTLITARLRLVLKNRVAEQTEVIRSANRELEKQLAQIRDENDLRNRIIKYSPSGMILFNASYTITLMNKSAVAISGIQEDRVGTSVLELPVFGEILRENHGDLFQLGATVENRSIRLGNSPSRTRTFNYTMHQVILYGKVIGILLTIQDMTKAEQMKQAEFEQEKNQAMMRIVAGIAHEIRNPLMSIRTFASLVGTKGDDQQVQESFAYYVPREVDRINKLVENLIHYAKPVRPTPEVLCAAELVDESLALVRPVLKKTGVKLEHALDSSLYITADRDQIKQVLINLLMNGVEATEERCRREAPSQPPALAVSVNGSGDTVMIRVRDRGIGMSPEELRQCRDPFFSTKKRGTGLGLSLCEQYVKENGGVMRIESIPMDYTQIDLVFERSFYAAKDHDR